MTTQDKILAAIEALGARIEAIESAPRARSRTKVARDKRTMAERREQAVGGRCDVHDKNFASAAGYGWHMENIAHD